MNTKQTRSEFQANLDLQGLNMVEYTDGLELVEAKRMPSWMGAAPVRKPKKTEKRFAFFTKKR